jgi:hypothetical protein
LYHNSNQTATTMKKELFNTAWQFIKDGLFTAFADALKAAWNKLKLVAALKKGVAYFQYNKVEKDGTVVLRNAIGTLHGSNYQYESKGSNRPSNPANVLYWDLEKRAFRSLKMVNFIGFM